MQNSSIFERSKSSPPPQYPPDGLISQSWIVSLIGTELWRIGTSDENAEEMLNWVFHELKLLGLLQHEKICWDSTIPEGFSNPPTSVTSRTQVTFDRLNEVILDRFLKLHSDQDEASSMVGLIFYNLRHLHLIHEDRIVWQDED